MIILHEMPMPPTGNHRLMPVNGRLIKTKECRLFDQACQVWMIRQRSALYDYRRTAKEWIDTGFLIRVEFRFFFPKTKILNKDGHPKKIDATNRLKDSEDAVSEVIDIDDKFFTDGSWVKMPWDKSYECFTAVLTPSQWYSQETHELPSP